LPGIKELAGRVLGLPVRLAQPENITGLADELRSPAFSTSLGLIAWAKMQQETQLDGYHYGTGWPIFDFKRAAGFLKRLLPG
jgi:cell division protein FtsA